MTFREKIKTIDNKNEQKKSQYDLDRQTALDFCFIIRKC